ncbi:MAG: DUF3750 domain-containing protein [Flavobacteriales bacterium]|nr:DUF3750 domain-containing protein [Flavobacteriales bacterium]
MRPTELKQLILADQFQVFLFAAPLPIPVNFAVHAWFVINLQGNLERWEFGKFRNSGNPKGVGILKDFIHPTGGLQKYLWKGKKGSTSELLATISGSQGSLAHEMALFIQHETPHYPLQSIYRYLGPNSNTYAQWVIDNFPESGFALPLRAIGRNYKGKHLRKLKLIHDKGQSTQ